MFSCVQCDRQFYLKLKYHGFIPAWSGFLPIVARIRSRSYLKVTHISEYTWIRVMLGVVWKSLMYCKVKTTHARPGLILEVSGIRTWICLSGPYAHSTTCADTISKTPLPHYAELSFRWILYSFCWIPYSFHLILINVNTIYK